MYKFTSTCVFLRDKDQVIIANRKNGQWIKISDEVMDILNIICVQDTAEDIEYADTSDKNYNLTTFSPRIESVIAYIFVILPTPSSSFTPK